MEEKKEVFYGTDGKPIEDEKMDFEKNRDVTDFDQLYKEAYGDGMIDIVIGGKERKVKSDLPFDKILRISKISGENASVKTDEPMKQLEMLQELNGTIIDLFPNEEDKEYVKSMNTKMFMLLVEYLLPKLMGDKGGL